MSYADENKEFMMRNQSVYGAELYELLSCLKIQRLPDTVYLS